MISEVYNTEEATEIIYILNTRGQKNTGKWPDELYDIVGLRQINRRV